MPRNFTSTCCTNSRREMDIQRRRYYHHPPLITSILIIPSTSNIYKLEERHLNPPRTQVQIYISKTLVMRVPKGKVSILQGGQLGLIMPWYYSGSSKPRQITTYGSLASSPSDWTQSNTGISQVPRLGWFILPMDINSSRPITLQNPLNTWPLKRRHTGIADEQRSRLSGPIRWSRTTRNTVPLHPI
jgi:hypothetical protein